MIHEIIKKGRKITQQINDARAFQSLPVQCYGLLKHRFLLNISFSNYYHYRFFDPRIPWEEKENYVCEHGSRYWPYQLDPLKYTATLSSKYIQKHLLRGFDLPTPPILFTMGATMEISTFEEFAARLRQVDCDFVLKPFQGSGGHYILVIENHGGQYFHDKKDISAAQLWAHIETRFNSGFYIEPRLHNSAFIRAMSPDCLNTYRVVTIRTADGRYHTPYCILRLGRAGSQIDNIQSGGIRVPINNEGVTFKVDPDTADTHPDTDATLFDLSIANYAEVVELAVRASKCFHFLGTIGWDIADTEDGLTIIEGNTLWGPVQMPILNDEIKRGLRRYHCFSRWDKAAIYPRMNYAPLWRRLLNRVQRRT